VQAHAVPLLLTCRVWSSARQVIIGGKKYIVQPPPPPAPTPSLPPIDPPTRPRGGAEADGSDGGLFSSWFSVTTRSVFPSELSAAEAAERAAAQRASEQKAASVALEAALRAVEFGQIAGSASQLRGMRTAIEAAHACGMSAGDLARAEQIEAKSVLLADEARAAAKVAEARDAERRARKEKRRVDAAKAAAEARAAAERAAMERALVERAAAERAAVEKAMAEKAAAERRAEMVAAREMLRRSVAKPTQERKRILRDLQLKWHPDKQYGDEESREFAGEIARLVNEAANVARQQAAAEAARRKRQAAFDALQPYITRFGARPDSLGALELRTAIQNARDTGVSDGEVAKAEAALKRLEGQY
jgi:hypothetical protein